MINTYVVNTSQMCTDWVSAILPVFIVLPLQMPKRRKVLAASVLGLGVIASIAAVARLPVYASTTSANYLCMSPKSHYAECLNGVSEIPY